ncbi:hypothetical protein BC828DRAFT_375288 [Blastocladiella britannica]|nr:hypothetical protein BC828DRAFT_375288 [Blastocladiella britannica]
MAIRFNTCIPFLSSAGELGNSTDWFLGCHVAGPSQDRWTREKTRGANQRVSRILLAGS